jgi:hypothetical protein
MDVILIPFCRNCSDRLVKESGNTILKHTYPLFDLRIPESWRLNVGRTRAPRMAVYLRPLRPSKEMALSIKNVS